MRTTYIAYGASQGWVTPSEITTLRVIEWFTHLATTARVTPSTMHTYRSALASAYTEQCTPHSVDGGINPVSSETISRLLAGIDRAYAAAQPTRADPAPVRSDGVTIAMITAMAARAAATGSGSRSIMMLAAAALATAALMRPSELLGSSANRDRALQLDQITFYADASSSIALDPAAAQGALPDHLRVVLRAWKTQKTRHAVEPIYIATPVVVTAMWQWFIRRREIGVSGIHVFRIGDDHPVTATALIKYVEATVVLLGFPITRFTPKGFRIGGATMLAASGVSTARINIAGRWAPSSTVSESTYVGPAARRLEMIAITRSMQ